MKTRKAVGEWFCVVYTKSIYIWGKQIKMKNLSLKLEDDIFMETEKILTKVNMNRNRYINEAIAFYNRLHRRKMLSRQLMKESRLVSGDSMKVLAEFEKFQDED